MTYTIQIVTYNSDTYLDAVLEHCWKLTQAPIAILIIDNGSTDDTHGIIHRHQKMHPGMLMLLRNSSNLGFARAHNQAFALSRRKGAEACLVLNPDVFLQHASISILLDLLIHRPECGSVTGKLLRMNGSDGDHQWIDSAGLIVTRTLRVIDRGAGDRDRGQFETITEVLGGSGAATLYRMSALTDIQLHGGEFDEKFFAYKEDVDLAFRLRWRGWQCWYHPTIIGHHVRNHRGGTFREIVRQRAYRSIRTRQYSYRNHFWMLLKNVPLRTFIARFFWVTMYECALALYLLFTEPRTLMILPAVIRGIPRVWLERRIIFSSARCRTQSFHQWQNFTV